MKTPRLSSINFALAACRDCSEYSPWHGLAGAMLYYACRDAGDRRNPRRAAEARYWLLFGEGSFYADLAGVGLAVRAYVAGLPALPGQNGGPAVLELARLAWPGRPAPPVFARCGQTWHVVRPGGGKSLCGRAPVDLEAAGAPPVGAKLCRHCEKFWALAGDLAA